MHAYIHTHTHTYTHTRNTCTHNHTHTDPLPHTTPASTNDNKPKSQRKRTKVDKSPWEMTSSRYQWRASRMKKCQMEWDPHSPQWVALVHLPIVETQLLILQFIPHAVMQSSQCVSVEYVFVFLCSASCVVLFTLLSVVVCSLFQLFIVIS